jgi:hypothetical protein
METKARKWFELLQRERHLLALSDLEFSSLAAWVMDCHRSFQQVYDGLLTKISAAGARDYELMHDCVVEISLELDHIKEHIQASEKGFMELMRVLAVRAEEIQREPGRKS